MQTAARKLSVVADTYNDLLDRLRGLKRDELLAMYDAAAEVTECLATLADAGRNPVTEVIGGAEAVEEWAHFPPGDVVDPSTHSQFYYHAHAAAERIDDEHGHFHTFVRPTKLFPKLLPVALPDGATSGQDASGVTHLVGISTDATGRLLRLFTTNRWVTDEKWYGADDAIRMLDRFDMTVEQPSRELNRWVSAVVRMYRPQIEDLLRARDAAVARHQAAHPGRDVFEDRALQVTSEIPIDYLAQVRAIESALAATPA
jgi:hypothetical protein